MATTNFSSGTIISSTWLNEVDAFVFGPSSFNAAGDGVTDDTAELQAALDTGKDVYLPEGNTYLFTTTLTMSTSHQKLYGPGILKPSGAINGITLNGNAVGQELSVTFNSSVQTSGYCVYINNAHRVNIAKLNIMDGYGGVYITKANTVRIEYMWATLRGPGIKWYGDDSNRSDILYLDNVLIDPLDTEYGLDWDGNCHSLEVKYLGIVGGKGMIIRNTDGVSTYPAIGRIGHIEVDYSTASGIEIQAGLDYDFVMPYVLGSAVDGFKIAAAINDYEVRISGGKSVGNTGYGINNAGGVVLFSGSTAVYTNTAGNYNGDIWTLSPAYMLDATSGFSLDANSDPQLTFDTDDYMAYDRSTNTLFDVFNGVNGFTKSVSSGNPILGMDTNDYLVYDRTNNLFRVFIAGAAHLTLGADLGNYANDATAEAAGVPLYGLYRNGGAVTQRVV